MSNREIDPNRCRDLRQADRLFREKILEIGVAIDQLRSRIAQWRSREEHIQSTINKYDGVVAAARVGGKIVGDPRAEAVALGTEVAASAAVQGLRAELDAVRSRILAAQRQIDQLATEQRRNELDMSRNAANMRNLDCITDGF